METRNIKDFLHLYLGCEVEWQDGSKEKLSFYWLHKIQGSNWWDIIKPILRPLSDMTEEEFKEFKGIADNDFSQMMLIASVKEQTRLAHEFTATAYLLSKHFDLFGLIEAGLAVDKTKFK